MVTIQLPLPYQVQQQNAQGNALITVAGTCSASISSAACVITPIRGGKAITQLLPVRGGRFREDLIVTAGWYSIIVSGTTPDKVMEQAVINRFGVGEVFVVAGHSVAQGDSSYTLAGALDERVITVPINLSTTDTKYRDSGLAADLPTAYAPYGTGIMAAPFGSSTHFWAKFGEQVAAALNVPVLIFNAAFGGTSLEMWSKTAKGQSFQHPFVNASKGFPYVNLKNALTKYIAATGCRAVLVDHGQNDTGEPDGVKLQGYYQDIIRQARLDSGAPELPFVVNRQTPGRSANYIRSMQERVIAETPFTYAGPDYDALMVDAVDRYDGIHLNESGMAKAAQGWAAVVTAAGFRTAAVPFQANPVPLIAQPTVTPVTSSLSGNDLTTIVIERSTASTRNLWLGGLITLLGLAASWYLFNYLNRRLMPA